MYEISLKFYFIRSFDGLYVEISSMPSCSTFGYTSRSDQGQRAVLNSSTEYSPKGGTRNLVWNGCKGQTELKT